MGDGEPTPSSTPLPDEIVLVRVPAHADLRVVGDVHDRFDVRDERRARAVRFDIGHLVGVDFGVFNENITGTADFYLRNSFDLIGLMQTSGVGGNAFKFGNYADMASEGFEVSINTVNLTINDFTWATNFNIGYTRDRITRLDFNPRLADAIARRSRRVACRRCERRIVAQILHQPVNAFQSGRGPGTLLETGRDEPLRGIAHRLPLGRQPVSGIT